MKYYWEMFTNLIYVYIYGNVRALSYTDNCRRNVRWLTRKILKPIVFPL